MVKATLQQRGLKLPPGSVVNKQVFRGGLNIIGIIEQYFIHLKLGWKIPYWNEKRTYL